MVTAGFAKEVDEVNQYAASPYMRFARIAPQMPPAENTDVSLVAGIADGSVGGQALEPAKWSLCLGGFQEGSDHRDEHVGAVGHPDV
jgi:hypothetical protein